MRVRLGVLIFAVAGFVLSVGAAEAQERLPQQVAGTWRITRVLPVRAASACWGQKEIEPLVGSALEYSQHAMRWRGGSVSLTGITTRAVSAEDLQEESQVSVKLVDLGIGAKSVTEVNMQHEDADITGSTTEVPGDSVLVAGPGRMVVSACAVYLEARRRVPRAVPVVTAIAAVPGSRRGM